jgi:hypothetical protein
MVLLQTYSRLVATVLRGCILPPVVARRRAVEGCEPPAEMAAQMLRRAGKCMWRPERVVCVAGGGVVGGALAGWLKLFLKSVPLSM